MDRGDRPQVVRCVLIAPAKAQNWHLGGSLRMDGPQPADDGCDPQAASRIVARIRDAVSSVVVGKEDTVDKLLIAVLCRGHALLEDVPGVGKTLLARSLAMAMGCAFHRIQIGR